MSKYIFSLIVFLSLHSFCFSQDIIEVTAEQDNAGSYTFSCYNHDICKYTVEVSFAGLYNLSSQYTFPHKFDVGPGQSRLFVLKPSTMNNRSSFSYSYKYFKGTLNPRVKSDFVYLIPVGNGKATKVLGFTYLKINEKDPEPKDWYIVGFSTKFQDTIYAARGGIVTEMTDPTHLKLSGYSYASNENYIQIFHDDCTFGRYEVFSRIFVKLGQTIEAGEPIGLAGGEKYASGAHVRFSVHYNYEPKEAERNKAGNGNSILWAYVPAVFCTKENKNIRLTTGSTYTADYPESIVTQEMSNRQIKRWKQNKMGVNKK